MTSKSAAIAAGAASVGLASVAMLSRVTSFGGTCASSATISRDFRAPGAKRLTKRVARFLNWRGAGRRVTDMADVNRNATTPVQKVVVVNGNTEVIGMLETVLDAGRYDMVFVESSDRAYSQIKKVLPNLVILCARIEELDGFQLLTMLKLDAETRQIPVLTYTTEYEGQDFDAAISQIAEDEEEQLPSRPALRMN
jgi:CheY-like chemotaxis protein